MLIPLAATVTTEKLCFGDYLVKQGEVVDRLFIISSGDLRVIVDTRLPRELKNEFFRPKPKPMTYKRCLERDTKVLQSQTMSA